MSNHCLYQYPSGTMCGRPRDHEVHDADRAKNSGWKLHAFIADAVVSFDSMVEGLYDLTNDELRRLAIECLLITDGPDKREENA